MMINSYSKETSQSRIGGLGVLTNILKNASRGNPYHDELGRFTSGPSTAFGKYNPSDNEVYDKLSKEGMRLGFDNVDSSLDNGTLSIKTRLENADGVDAIVRSSMLGDKIKLSKPAQDAVNKANEEVGYPTTMWIADTANKANTQIAYAIKDVEALASAIANASIHNYSPKDDQSALAGRSRMVETAQKSLDTAKKYLDGREKKLGKSGAGYVAEARQAISALQAATNTLKYLSSEIPNGALHDVAIVKPKK